MFCAHCGNSLKEGARFCSACGAPVVDTEPSSSDIEEPASSFGSIAETKSEQSSQGAFASQMESDRERSRRKLSPLLIVAIALALLAGTALAAVLITQQANQGEKVPEQGQEAGPSSSAEPELTPEEAAIEALDGWWESQWHKPPYLPAYGHVHDGVIDWYRADTSGSSGAISIDYSSTVNITRAERFDENGTQGWRFFTDTSSNDSWAYYQADGEPDELPIYMVADGYGIITETHTDHPTRFGMRRITDDFNWEGSMGTRELFEKAKQLAAARDGGASSSSSASAFDQAEAEAEARAAAEAAGKTILTGTIAIGTESDWAAKKGLPGPANPGSTFTYVGLILDEPVTVSAHNADGGTVREQPFVERSGDYVLLGSDFQSNAVDLWEPYDGQRVSVAFSDFTSFSDSLGVYFSFKGNGERIAPLSEADIRAASATATASAASDYVFPDSNTRHYSRQELEKYDNHTLFLARNEIYARHGRKFENSELQQYFGSKPWYRGTIAPDNFDEGVFNDSERANAYLIRDIETERGSEYLK